MSQNYVLLDCGNQRKLEKFGEKILIRPCPQALWQVSESSWWDEADLEFLRTNSEKGYWQELSSKTSKTQDFQKEDLNWVIESDNGLKWNIELNDFGNVGVFTEHWLYAEDLLRDNFFDKSKKVLNLFTYSGSNCMVLAKDNYQITAVDSSKSAMNSYTKNLAINNISKNGLRLILEDVYKFIAREERRGNLYGGIMIDAPSYGRGTKGEIFKIEDNLVQILQVCKNLLDENGKIILTLHSPRFTPTSLKILVQSLFPKNTVMVQEIIQVCKSKVELPSGFLVKAF